VSATPLLATVGLAATMSATTTAQGLVLDRASFVVTRGSEVIGREEFTLRRGRQSGGAGLTLTVNALYPAGRASPIMVATIEFGPDSQPATARLDLDAQNRPSVFVAMSSHRVTVRTLTPRGESARQFPAMSRAVMLDEFLLSPLSLLPGRQEGQLTIFDARRGSRDVARLSDRGMGSVEVGGVKRELRHMTLGSGPGIHHLWFDESGYLIKVDIPQTGITAVRLPTR
jgi:hypothetical protein